MRAISVKEILSHPSHSVHLTQFEAIEFTPEVRQFHALGGEETTTAAAVLKEGDCKAALREI